MIVGNSLIILDKSSCWNFLSLGQDGYGKINIDNKTRRVPRVIISILRGEDLEDMSWVACHHCDNPACIRPSHLYAGTILENERDKNKRGRRPRGFGSVNCATKPIREEVNSKYLEGNLSMKEVGKLFGISACTVHRIVHGFAGMGRN